MKRDKLLILLACLILYRLPILAAQDLDNKEQENHPISLFTYDTCSAPCWFGLTPGESTSNDLRYMLQLNNKYFHISPPEDSDVYSSDGLLLDGYIELRWVEQNLPLDDTAKYLLIGVDEGIIQSIKVPVRKTRKIFDVLEIYGDPDFASLLFTQTYTLDLVYVDESLVVSLSIFDEAIEDTFGEVFNVEHVRYFKSIDLEEIIESYILGQIFAEQRRLVPLETIQCWADGRDKCISSWWDLPEDKEVDLSQWLTPTPAVDNQPASIFPYNTCMSPCWMGIIPGVSTSLDVDTIFEQYPEIVSLGEYGRTITRLPNGEYAIDNIAGIIQLGGYRFTVMTPISHLPSLPTSSRIEIRSGLVDLVMILANQEDDISLSMILNNLGEPDYIRMYSIDDFDTSEFRLIYIDTLTTINLFQSDEICQTDNLLDNFNLLNIFYNSQQSASELIPSVDPNILQPRLFTYWFETERDVPIDLWESWLSGELSEPCLEAWEKLAPPDLEAIAITPTPHVELTAEPTP